MTVGKAPGVYVIEGRSVGPIVGVGTSTVAMIGEAKQLATGVKNGVPRAVTSWTAFTTMFGEFDKDKPLAYAVRGFFANGGSFLYVIPVEDTEDLAKPVDQLTRLPDVNIVCAPGVTGTAAKPLIEHCIAARDRFAVIDGTWPAAAATPPPNGNAPDGNAPDGNAPATQPADPIKSVKDGTAQLNASEFAAVYWPWLWVDDPTADMDAEPEEKRIQVPPSGHIAGIMARSDARYGVHKAPANEEILGALDVTFPVNATEHGELNDKGINVLRQFGGRPPMVWGARTLNTTDIRWRYVNVRRLMSFIEESLTQGLNWAVFEANNTSLWKSLERTTTEFLDRVWRAGALFGRTASEAYYVRIDEELNPDAVRKEGQVFIEIGVAPVAPAEFVTVKLGLLTRT